MEGVKRKDVETNRAVLPAISADMRTKRTTKNQGRRDENVKIGNRSGAILGVQKVNGKSCNICISWEFLRK